jgi:hypothetical protein
MPSILKYARKRREIIKYYVDALKKRIWKKHIKKSLYYPRLSDVTLFVKYLYLFTINF